jgi:Na+/citrate or Na+/malate symporter
MGHKHDRVVSNTAASVLARIDMDTKNSLEECTSQGEGAIARRIQELDKEWDTDRMIEAEASLMALLGLTLGATVNRKFFLLPGFVASMVLVHAVQGWYPLLPLFRRSGARTSREINRERYALKTLRGDFDDISGLSPRDYEGQTENVQSDGRLQEAINE